MVSDAVLLTLSFRTPTFEMQPNRKPGRGEKSTDDLLHFPTPESATTQQRIFSEAVLLTLSFRTPTFEMQPNRKPGRGEKSTDDLLHFPTPEINTTSNRILYHPIIEKCYINKRINTCQFESGHFLYILVKSRTGVRNPSMMFIHYPLRLQFLYFGQLRLAGGFLQPPDRPFSYANNHDGCRNDSIVFFVIKSSS